MPVQPTVVPAKEASASAWKTLQIFLTNEEAGPYAAAWSVYNLPEGEGGGGNLFQPDGLPIYDYKGRLLYYEFKLSLQNGTEFRARAAADKALGSPVLQMAATKPFDVTAWRDQTVKFATANGFTIENPNQIICYAVPKLGLMARNSSNAQFVIDMAQQIAIPVPTSSHSVVAPSGDLLQVWSPLDGAAATPAKLELFATKEAALSSFKLSITKDFAEAPPPATQNTLNLTLSGQETPVYCAVASAQMILAYHGIQATQDAIAAVMQTGPDGSTLDNQLIAFAQISKNKYSGTLHSPAVFESGQQQINNKAPIKSGIPGHARVAAGWKTQTTGDSTSRWLYIYDPWPPSTGQVYWEDWGAVIHTNDIFVDPAGVT